MFLTLDGIVKMKNRRFYRLGAASVFFFFFSFYTFLCVCGSVLSAYLPWISSRDPSAVVFNAATNKWPGPLSIDSMGNDVIRAGLCLR